jgi:arginine decarboxylase
MPKPTSRILVVNDAPKALASIVRGLNAAARSLDNPFGLTAIGVSGAAGAIAAIETDGDIQAALVDDRLYGLDDDAADNSLSAVELVRHINALRPEVDVFILIDRAQEDEVVDSLFTESVDGYFYREEHDPRGMFRIIQAALAERARTPFFDALRSYVLMAKDAWHTPGHSSGDSRNSSDMIMALMPTDLPEPVVPAIRRCGMRARSTMTGSPPMALPRASGNVASPLR